MVPVPVEDAGSSPSASRSRRRGREVQLCAAVQIDQVLMQAVSAADHGEGGEDAFAGFGLAWTTIANHFGWP